VHSNVVDSIVLDVKRKPKKGQGPYGPALFSGSFREGFSLSGFFAILQNLNAPFLIGSTKML
jgi:hypothetical protein